MVSLGYDCVGRRLSRSLASPGSSSVRQDAAQQGCDGGHEPEKEERAGQIEADMCVRDLLPGVAARQLGQGRDLVNQQEAECDCDRVEAEMK